MGCSCKNGVIPVSFAKATRDSESKITTLVRRGNGTFVMIFLEAGERPLLDRSHEYVVDFQALGQPELYMLVSPPVETSTAPACSRGE